MTRSSELNEKTKFFWDLLEDVNMLQLGSPFSSVHVLVKPFGSGQTFFLSSKHRCWRHVSASKLWMKQLWDCRYLWVMVRLGLMNVTLLHVLHSWNHSRFFLIFFPYIFLCSKFGLRRLSMAEAKRYDSSSTSLESIGPNPARGHLESFQAAAENLLGQVQTAVPDKWNFQHPDRWAAPADTASESTWRWRKKTLIHCISSIIFGFFFSLEVWSMRYIQASVLQAKRSYQLCWSTGNQYLAAGQARLLASLRKSRLQANAWTCCFGCNWKPIWISQFLIHQSEQPKGLEIWQHKFAPLQ